MLTAVWLALTADVKVVADSADVVGDVADDVLVLVDSILAVLEVAWEVASKGASEVVLELDEEVVSSTAVVVSVVERVVDIDLDVVEVVLTFLVVVVESSSGQTPSVHGSTEQHPVYGPALQTYHCLPSVQVLPACCKPSILGEDEEVGYGNAKERASRVSHEIRSNRSRSMLGGNIERCNKEGGSRAGVGHGSRDIAETLNVLGS